MCLSPHGRRNGEALACFKDKLLTEVAIARHKHHMGKRYIEVRVNNIICFIERGEYPTPIYPCRIAVV